MKRSASFAVSLAISIVPLAVCFGQSSGELVLDRKGETIVLEPYAANILRVTLSLQRDNALAKPGYGLIANPNSEAWSATQTDLNDVYRSSSLIVTVERPHPPLHPKLPTELDIAKYFNGSTPGAHITFTTPDGKKLLEMTGWDQAVPNHKDGTAGLNNDRRPTDPDFFTVGATFVSPDDEHYYGLGDNQEGFLDHRHHPVRCWNDYTSPAAPSTCVPFMITNKGYGILWDNPSKTIIEPGFNEQTKWKSEVGDRVSFFVIAGNTADRHIAGAAPDRVAGAAPNRRVAAAADDRLVAEVCVDELVAAAANDRIAGNAADRHIAGAAPDRIASAAPDRPVAGAAADD